MDMVSLQKSVLFYFTKKTPLELQQNSMFCESEIKITICGISKIKFVIFLLQNI
jgi:hypothetical protein